jgi:hypothetical protein
MSASYTRPRRKNFLKVILIITGILFFAIFGLQVWLVHNARDVLKQIVLEKSDGNLKLELSRVRFNFFSNRLQIREADLASLDNISQPATYHVKFRKLTLRIRSFWPLLLDNKLLLDSIKLHDPDIEIVQWRKDILSVARNDLSISQEMGLLYNSMLDVLDAFGIRRIIVNNARVSLINKIKSGSEPITVSNIYLDLVRTAKGTDKRDEFVKDAQSVDLRATNQNIALPGGRHLLSFKTFRLQLFRKRVELDSCTIIARATDSTKSSYKIFFKKLLLIGVDFDAMYRRNLIRADSVYCENPLFDININRLDAVLKKREKPDPSKIVRDLTGDLDLAFIGVKNAGIHIDISGGKNRTLFNSNKDNFEMRGLRVNSDTFPPVSVQRFDMLVRDYHLYNEDSSTAYTFDSIHFVNSKIVLNNFSVATKAIHRDLKDFNIPYFELTGIDWYQLIFEQKIRAQEAALYNPVINYTKRTPSRKNRKANMFALLENVDNLVTLDKINIFNGNINMKLADAASLNLQNANLILYSNNLLQSTTQDGLRRAVDRFSFSDGVIKLKDITAKLQNVSYTGSNLIHADKLYLSSGDNKFKAFANDVLINNMLLDDKTGTILSDGLQWKNASVFIQVTPALKTKNKSESKSFNLKNIYGNHTRFEFTSHKTNITTFLQSVKFSSFSKNRNQPVRVNGLLVLGNKLLMKDGTMNVKLASYQLADNKPSYLSGVEVKRIHQRDSVTIQSPRINFFANINAMLANDIHFTNVQAQAPVIKLSRWNKEVTAFNPDAQNPSVRIDRIIVNNPDIKIATYSNDSITRIIIPKTGDNVLKASGVRIFGDEIELGSVTFNTTSALVTKSAGVRLGVEKGKIELDLSKVRLSKKDGKPLWSLLVNNFYLQNFNSITSGKNKNKLLLKEASIGNLSLSSNYQPGFNQLVKFDVSSWMRTGSGQYMDTNTILKWFNADYNYSNQTFSLDSFSYHPAQARDSVMAKTPHQTDYITFNTGTVKFTGFNLEKYSSDSVQYVNTVNITNPEITIFRDMDPPFLAGIIKPLPVNMIKKIALPLFIENVNIIDGSLSYTEKNKNTRAEGTVLLARLNGGLSNIKNHGFEADDSLSLTLNAYLMDSALINLKVKQSYTDSLSGFVMALKMKPTSLTFLNPVLAPMSNIKITSGTIDSFHLRAIGKEELSLGKMNMYYHNLKIKLVNDGNANNTNFVTNAVSWLANTFLIKKNNNGRTGIVYFERLRDHSFWNYIVKMTFSGMSTSIGVKKNKKLMKRYKRELRERELPPIDFK